MSVELSSNRRVAQVQRGSGYYLMQLRRHVAETEGEARRAKLLVGEWSASRVQFVPILQRPPRIGPE